MDTLSSVYVVPSADDKVGHPQQSFFPLCTLDSSCLSQIMDCKSTAKSSCFVLVIDYIFDEFDIFTYFTIDPARGI